MSERKKTGGRKAGIPNKVTAEVKLVAQQYVPDALKKLHEIMMNSDSDQAKVSAAREILDRACGKPAQAITAEHGIKVSATTLSMTDMEIIERYQRQQLMKSPVSSRA